MGTEKNQEQRSKIEGSEENAEEDTEEFEENNIIIENAEEEEAEEFEENIHLVDQDKTDNIFGGLVFDTTEEIEIPDSLINQVIGQKEAREKIKNAAHRGRHVMMIGKPGTGKSMLAKSMTEIMDNDNLKDVVVFANEEDEQNPIVRTYPAGKGSDIVEKHKKEIEKSQNRAKLLMWGLIGFTVVYTVFTSLSILFGIIGAVIIYFVFNYFTQDSDDMAPNLLIDNSDRNKAPYEDATGVKSGSLLGDVRHDPFQSGGMGTPPHQRVESGKIHESNGGVLFIDEIRTLPQEDQTKLLTAMQDGELQITGQSEKSSGSMVTTQHVPTDFTLVAAGNMDAMEEIHPAIRDRIKGYGSEVFMEDKIEDTSRNRRKFVRFVAQEVDRDGDIPHFTQDAVKEIIHEARRRAGEKGKLTLELRGLGGLIRKAGDIALEQGQEVVTKDNVLKAKEMDKSIEQQYVGKMVQKKKKYNQIVSSGGQIGRVNGLAVMGDDSGIVLPVVSKISDTQNKGKVIATGKLQEIAEEAVENVSAIVKDVENEDLSDKDIHIQFVQTYEGVDGDSASITVATAVLSALKDIPIRQDVAMTGSLSVRGNVLPVGGVTHKIEAAAEAGMNTVIIPESNKDDVMIEDKYKDQIEIKTVSNIRDVIDIAFENDNQSKKSKLLEDILPDINISANATKTVN